MIQERIKPWQGKEARYALVFGIGLVVLGIVISTLTPTLYATGAIEGHTDCMWPLSFFGLVLASLGGPYVISESLRAGRTRRLFDQAFTTAEAQIIDHYIVEHESVDPEGFTHTTTAYLVAFVFSVQSDAGEEKITLQTNVGKQFFDTVQEGQMLTVRYANADPRIVLLEGEW